ncbi:alginate lyase family protein [Treponema zioleckii]|uniref:alginate lyase family protein n=1 Tax=Treponema zioleckii TaxID=331680 RepID=UPI00168BD199|nr:alginate lyase family protein [Treponema zioleckii]
MKAEEFFNQNKHFFFEDRDAVASYVKENCKEDFEHIKRVADEVCNKVFIFDLRSDMERTCVPVKFEGEIDWLRQPADDPEWIYAFNRMKYWICLGQAYAATKDEKYAKAFAEQLVSWVKNVPHTEKNALAWRTIEVGLRMEFWLKAMCYFKGSPNITDEVMTLFVQSMTEHAEFIMTVWNSYNLMSNWGVLANHGLFMAGVMLPSTERTKEYVAESLRRLSEELSIQVYEDGAQWEQSPMYHNEVTHDFLDILILAFRNGIKLDGSFTDKVLHMIYAAISYQKPDGNELCFGDSDEIDRRDNVTTAAAIFGENPFYEKFSNIFKKYGYEKVDFDSAWDIGEKGIKFYNEQKISEDSDFNLNLESSGNYFLLEEDKKNRKNSTFLHFHCGTLGAGHGHSDQLHVSLYANGEDLLIDAGRFTYVNKPERFEFKDSTAHNTCIVDNKNFYECSDSWGCSKLNRAVNRAFNQIGQYAYIEGGHLGYIDFANGGVFTNRRVIKLRKDLFVIADEFYTGNAHKYSQFWHFNNTGTVLSQTPKNSDSVQKFRYSSKQNDLDLVQIAGNASSLYECSIIDTRFSKHYNEAEENKTLKTDWDANGFTSLYTILSLNKAGEAQDVTVKKLPVYSNFKNIEFTSDVIEALEIQKGDEKFTLVIAHKEYASPTDTFCAGGEGLKTDETNFQTSKGGLTGFGNVVVFNKAGERTVLLS